ncbi:hypothetical protein WICANDRAFT_76973 [Wickerhamomyces anomalus NRRL Y-366-8]|uniref:Uncharacterized protein n=1 Tax=Wickerhamomyces anomalus (strain ATCC 58044 / CBS 1984 / NCYC 433 / NRRL Y-366-8) TaxID=683960 RepID=A0A1E3PCX3_WICAA|nr:uncharacterized protein WICANDRAFT_76973 [Wickerhamomyces anomalus NRRL Y-366-8]ODQ62812.1 hypothetical protein WICANDRAFT_76973 [Wickerhamomyces anomalus NRRL Y-366-8]
MPITKTQREVLSGLTAGFITTTVTHPLDLLKIRLQLDISSKTHIEALSKIFKGFQNSASPTKEIYRGLPLNLIGGSSAWAIYFGSYRVFKDLLHDETLLDANLESWQYLISAFSAGSFTAVLTNPIWVLKTRILSTSKIAPGAYIGVIDGFKRVVKEEGILGFWKGLTPSLMGVSQGALQFTMYDTLKYRFRGDDGLGKLKVYEYIIMSCVSKITATLMVYPCQVLKSRLQDYESITKRKTVKQVVEGIWRLEGIGGFYKGVVPNIIRVLPATCITFGVYEQMRRIV